jgi:hypothetical protein
MRSDDVDYNIRQAIALGRGDKQAAARVLLGLCNRDDKLLRALVAPYLNGILFHAVEKAMNKMSPADLRSEELRPAPVKEVPKDIMDKLVDALGENIPVARPRRKGTPKTGEEVLKTIGIGPGDIPPPDAGERHQRAMKAVASSFKYKGK